MGTDEAIDNQEKPGDEINLEYMLSKSPAFLLLRTRIADTLVEVPLRPIGVDIPSAGVKLQQKCLFVGWHYFYRGDRIYDGRKFLLQRNLRAQQVHIVKKAVFCETLLIRYERVLSALGFIGSHDRSASICTRDVDLTAQPCHGMYGAPLICEGKAVGLMMAPDAQWINCTGYSNIIHLFSAKHIIDFMRCIEPTLKPEQPGTAWDDWQKPLTMAVGEDSAEEDSLEYTHLDPSKRGTGGGSCSIDVG